MPILDPFGQCQLHLAEGAEVPTSSVKLERWVKRKELKQNCMAPANTTIALQMRLWSSLFSYSEDYF